LFATAQKSALRFTLANEMMIYHMKVSGMGILSHGNFVAKYTAGDNLQLQKYLCYIILMRLPKKHQLTLIIQKMF